MINLIFRILFGALLFTSNFANADKLSTYNKYLEQQQFDEAYKIIKPMAQSGSDEAQYELGRFYEFLAGFGSPADNLSRFEWNCIDWNPQTSNNNKCWQKAAKWYEKAALGGHAFAQDRIGDLYTYGFGVERNFKRGALFIELAASQNVPNSIAKLGFIYLQGDFKKRDFTKARELFEKAASLDVTKAYFGLGIIHENGLGVSTNYISARNFYSLAALKGSATAAARLGALSEAGKGAEKDLIQAIMWYDIAHGLGNMKFAIRKEKLRNKVKRQDWNRAMEMAIEWRKERKRKHKQLHETK